jgi:hypothetical protein
LGRRGCHRYATRPPRCPCKTDASNRYASLIHAATDTNAVNSVNSAPFVSPVNRHEQPTEEIGITTPDEHYIEACIV